MSEAFKRLFPRAFFSRLQENNIRIDGRSNDECRKVTLLPNAIGTADSSALCTIGRTSVLCGIRYEVGPPTAAKPEEGRFEIKVDINGFCSANPSETTAIKIEQTLNNLVERGLINTKELCIQPSRAVWVLKCHIICLDDDGNIADACILAFIQSLIALRLPADIMIAEGDGQVRIMSEEKFTNINFNFMPKPLTIGLFDGGAGIIADPCFEEESVMEGQVLLLVDDLSDDFVGVIKSGGPAVSPDLFDRFSKMARDRVSFKVK